MTDTTEAPQEPVEAPEEEPETETTEEGAQAPEAPAEDEEEDPEAEAPTGPVVVNDDAGQHVVMPDGSVVHTRHDSYPRSNSEWEVYEVTHSGDQQRYSFKPGDKEYTPTSDPSVPDSWLAKQIETQLVSFPERVALDPAARPSPTWDALQPGYQGELAAAIETGGGGGKVEA